MATLVFWHVPLRFCKGEALANPRPGQAQRMLRSLSCMASLSIDLEVEYCGLLKALKYHVPLAIPLILHLPNVGHSLC